MIHAASPLPRPPRCNRLSQLRTGTNSRLAKSHVAYDRPFWLAYAANALTMVAVALLFRYADFVTLLGGTEFHLGWIVGVGMIGSLLTRLTLGSWIDRYGTRPLWLYSTLLFIVTCFAHLAVASYMGVAIYLLRISYCCALAGVYGASMTFICTRGPNERMAELVGMLGTANFFGWVLGTGLGDFLFSSVSVDRAQVEMMFVVAGLLGSLSLPFAWAATRAEQRPTSSTSHSLPTLLRHCHPGAVLVIGVAMGMGIGLPGTFLRPYAAELQIPRIGLFFMAYAIAVIITRIVARRWIERFGPRPIIALGMACLVVGLTLFLPVQSEWQLALPAIGFGCAQAFLFPSVVAAGSVTFPARHRGLAIVLMLATWDVGQLIGAPMAGILLRYSPLAGLPPYPTMFLTMAGLLALVSVWYAVRAPAKG